MTGRRSPEHWWLWWLSASFLFTALVTAAEDPPAKGSGVMAQQADPDRMRAEADRLGEEVVRLYGQGRYREATELARRVVRICEEVRGPEHPDTATSLNNLAAVLMAQRDYAAATSSYRCAWPSGARSCRRTTPISPPPWITSATSSTKPGN